ncbi:MAG: ribonuclease HI [Oscillospiraceae bacterium]|jgi:ribonuclease HI|nr:ribonuclease HI [Oscillospiraceae bacterium]
MKRVTIHTDGACSGNPGPGGWGAILRYDAGGKNYEREISGAERDTTNNRMELTAAIMALSLLTEACEVTLYSDSRYLVDGLSKGWAKSWRRKNWRKSDGKPALNTDLWERLLELCESHNVKLIWVKGHSDNEFNERCDVLAVNAYKRG